MNRDLRAKHLRLRSRTPEGLSKPQGLHHEVNAERPKEFDRSSSEVQERVSSREFVLVIEEK